MRRLFLLAIVLAVAVASKAGNDNPGQAQALASRLSPALAAKVEFHQMEADQGHDVFTLESRDDKVIIGGNNANSMAVGLNRYLNRYCQVTVSWYAGVPMELPDLLPDVPAPERITARVPQRFFLNYCTWGYTMPFWQWRDWETGWRSMA